MAWWNDRIRIAATLSIAGWVIVFVVGMSIIVPQALPAFGDSSGWIKWVLGWVMIGAAAAATEGLLRIWRGFGISRRSLDVAMMLILLGIGCWGLLSRILWGAHWIGWAGCLGASIVAALRLLAEWKE
jgi:hypothetical protein